jgi:hypothetical protein
MSEEDSITIEKKILNHFTKKEIQRENSLYPDPTPKCYIGHGNNSEL